MWHDLRYSVRSIVNHRLFAVTAAMMLAVGVGLTTAVFSAVHALLLRPLPVHEPQELVYVHRTMPKQPDRRIAIPHETIERLVGRDGVFNGVTGTWPITLRLTRTGETDLLQGEMVQPGYFEVLGVQGHLGRTRPAGATDPSVIGSVVLSYDLWRGRFRGDPHILGSTVTLAEELQHEFTVIGVAPAGFRGVVDPLTPTQFWVAASAVERYVIDAPSGVRTSFVGIARLASDVAVSQAQASVDVLNEAGVRLLLSPVSTMRLPVDPAQAIIPARLAAALTGAIALVFFVSISNIAGILMARGLTRVPEVAIRTVVGATPWRIARQLVMEGALLAATGGVLGVVLAHWLLAVLRAFTPAAYALDPSIDWRAVAFAAAACAFCGVAISIAPAAQAARTSVAQALSGTVTATPATRRRRLRHAVVLPQLAASLLLLVVAAAYVRAQIAVEFADPGYDSEHVLVIRSVRPGTNPPGQASSAAARADRARQYYQRLLAELQALPGVDAAISIHLPLHAPAAAALSTVTALDVETQGHNAMATSVSPGYFRTLNMQLLSGRDFDGRDVASGVPVAVISASLADRLWPTSNPVGRTISVVGPRQGARPAKAEVVGVVNDVRPVLMDADENPFVYFALGQRVLPGEHFITGRSATPSTTDRHIRAAVVAAHPQAQAFTSRRLNEMVAEILFPRRLAVVVLAASAIIALAVASLGLYGVIAYSVAQRLREIGIRRALGAEAHDIRRLVMREGLLVAALGSAAGFALAYISIRFLSSRFVAQPQIDVVTLLVAPLVLGVVVLLACLIPARRAATIDPLAVLRRS